MPGRLAKNPQVAFITASLTLHSCMNCISLESLLHRSFNEGMAVPQEKGGNVAATRRDSTTVNTCHGLPLCKKILVGCLIEPAQPMRSNLLIRYVRTHF
jgi:hypothetical protein